MANLEQRIQRVKVLVDWVDGYFLLTPGAVRDEYSALDKILKQAHIYNPWFIEQFIRSALSDFSGWLKGLLNTSEFWVTFADYKFETKQIAILTLSNVPLSGMREVILIFLAGYSVVLRNNDHKDDLVQYLTQLLVSEDDMGKGFRWVNNFPQDIDGWVIFNQPGQNAINQYFNKRKSLFLPSEKQFAVLNGNETSEQLDEIADFVFIYWGFTDGNVRKLYVPVGYNFNPFFEALEKYSFVYQYNCYANNYDYHKSVSLMNRIPFLDNGFILLREEASTDVPIGCLHYSFYTNEGERDELSRLAIETRNRCGQQNIDLLVNFIKSFKEDLH